MLVLGGITQGSFLSRAATGALSMGPSLHLNIVGAVEEVNGHQSYSEWLGFEQSLTAQGATQMVCSPQLCAPPAGGRFGEPYDVNENLFSAQLFFAQKRLRHSCEDQAERHPKSKNDRNRNLQPNFLTEQSSKSGHCCRKRGRNFCLEVTPCNIKELESAPTRTRTWNPLMKSPARTAQSAQNRALSRSWVTINCYRLSQITIVSLHSFGTVASPSQKIDLMGVLNDAWWHCAADEILKRNKIRGIQVSNC
jgi:hypothetical protein